MNAIPVGSRCFGKRGRLPTHNLITHGVEFCSAYVMQRIMQSRGTRAVSVDPAGALVVYAPNDKRVCTKPVEWLVGIYGKSAKRQDIADDMEIRWQELAGNPRSVRTDK